MVKLWGGRVARWGVLGLTVLIVVVFFGRLIFQLESRVHTGDKALAASKTALAVATAKIAERDQALSNLHVTVTQPPPQVTVTVAPGQMPVAGTSGAAGSSRVVTVPMPFPVPGPTVTPAMPSKTPTVTVTECPVVHLLFLCL